MVDEVVELLHVNQLVPAGGVQLLESETRLLQRVASCTHNHFISAVFETVKHRLSVTRVTAASVMRRLTDAVE